jgi:hypothetical protein
MRAHCKGLISLAFQYGTNTQILQNLGALSTPVAAYFETYLLKTLRTGTYRKLINVSHASRANNARRKNNCHLKYVVTTYTWMKATTYGIPLFVKRNNLFLKTVSSANNMFKM